MKLRSKLLLAAALLGCIATGALAQYVGGKLIASPTASSILDLTVSGSPIKNAMYLYQARDAADFLAVATGTTVNTTVPNTAGTVFATGAITTWNVVLPTAPYNGQLVSLSAPGGTVTTLAVTATSPASVSIVGTNPTTLTSGGAAANAVQFVYSTTDNKWYRLR